MDAVPEIPSPSDEPPTRRSLRHAREQQAARGSEEPAAEDLFADDAATEAQESESGDSPSANSPSGDSPKPAKGGSVVRSVIGIAGEVLITAGVLVFLFLGWQLWIQGIALNSAQTSEASGLSQSWSASTVGPTAPEPSPAATAGAGSPTTPVGGGSAPVVMTAPAETSQFAVLYVPRFGADYKRTISQGVDAKTVLNAGGAGHYEQSQMPGDMGNFAIAAHRDGWGSPFIKINELQVGDPIYVETQDGWYTYRFRDLEYVSPDGVDVLSAVPQAPDAAPTDRLITLTSCNPLYIASERIIAYGVLESFTPRSDGAPAAIAGLTGKGA
ncbi:class E sortase [Subtercola endophyticus]|uniref:class E sortase n=1 Tax=Subtercola endophyticus TaxID=2895559 RepID=UPI001E5147D0|nr:class E sortase [Subtercola endophyticus]UFS58381.1 class E sortase [Subtercola endophyticus]